MSIYDNNNELVSKNEWERQIEELTSSFATLIKDQERAVTLLKESIEGSFQNISKQNKRVGILFSGGVDSTLLAFLAQKHNIPFTCYAIGLKNAVDILEANRVATHYNFDFICRILSLDDLEKTTTEVVKLLKSTDIIWVSVGIVTYAGAILAKENYEQTILSGLGTEELFAGYARHEKAKTPKELQEECKRGLLSMYSRDLLRDITITKKANLQLELPYLSSDVIKAAMKIHPSLKLTNESNKRILRETAIQIGLDNEFANRPKKAAQYGSSVIKGLDKLAKRNGFKTKKEYFESILASI